MGGASRTLDGLRECTSGGAATPIIMLGSVVARGAIDAYAAAAMPAAPSPHHRRRMAR